MKKLLLIGATLVAVTLSSFAQVPFKSYSFIAPDVQSITISNTYMLTNLITAWAGAGVTNMAGITYTNNYGQRTVILGASTGNTKNLLRDAPFWSLRDGTPPWQVAAFTNSPAETAFKQSYINLNVAWITGSGTDQAVTFTFVPIMNGRNEVTTAAEEWAVAFTPIVSSTQCLTTNVPIWRWPGASGLRLRRVTYSDTTAVSQLTLTDISLNGFVPQ